MVIVPIVLIARHLTSRKSGGGYPLAPPLSSTGCLPEPKSEPEPEAEARAPPTLVTRVNSVRRTYYEAVN